jgi:hypothetical protein
MRCSDGQTYVVKFQNNPQGLRVLANDLLGGLLARQLGLPSPEVVVVDVSQALIQNSDDMTVHLTRTQVPYQSGLCFGSYYTRAQGLAANPRLATIHDLLAQNLFCRVDNLQDFLGMLVFDNWTANMDNRQVVFVQDEFNRSSWPYFSYHALMIDCGFCFNACEWTFPNNRKHGLYMHKIVYENVSGLDSFELWLNRIESVIDRTTIEEAAEQIPLEWNDGAVGSLKKLIGNLNQRRSLIRDLMLSVRTALPRYFPAWRVQNAAD